MISPISNSCTTIAVFSTYNHTHRVKNRLPNPMTKVGRKKKKKKRNPLYWHKQVLGRRPIECWYLGYVSLELLITVLGVVSRAHNAFKELLGRQIAEHYTSLYRNSFNDENRKYVSIWVHRSTTPKMRNVCPHERQAKTRAINAIFSIRFDKNH